MCRKLNANEISVRIGQAKYDDAKKITGASLLLYKDARVDMKILDEMYGTFGWQKSYEKIGDSLFCKISVFDTAKNQWISKEDVGTESNMEAVKGEASDAFKRAGFNFGIGRELYTAPFIWISGDLLKDKYDKFSVTEIGYTDDEISYLKITNDTKHIVVFQFNNMKITTDSIRAEMTRTGIEEKSVLEMFKVEKLDDLNDICRRAVMAKFSHTEDKK